MASLTICSMILLASCTQIGQVRTEDLSENFLNFLHIFNGEFDNSKQVPTHDLIQARFVPVNLPALSSGPMLFAEQADNGTTQILQLCAITEGSYNVIYLTPYNFTNASKYKPGEFRLDDLYKVHRENLTGDPDCKIAFVPEDKDIFVADWPDCRHVVNREHPLYPLTISCDEISAVVPVAASERRTLVPYRALRRRNRFPVKDVPDDYVSPCEKQ